MYSWFENQRGFSCNSPIHLIRSEWLKCIFPEVTRWTWLGCVVSKLVSLFLSPVSQINFHIAYPKLLKFLLLFSDL